MSRSQTIEPATIKRILVVKPCCFGDVMMATPALRALHHTFSSASIHVLTTQWCAEALRNNPNINGVYRYPSAISVVQFLRLVQRIKSQHYDLGISLDRSPIVNILLMLSGIPERAGIDSSGRGIGLTRRVAPVPNQHETELYLAVTASVGSIAQGSQPEYCTTEEARRTAKRLVEGLVDPIVVIHPGGAVNPGSTLLTKRWPAVMYGELASELVQRDGASIVVVGAESDADAVQGAIDFTDAQVTDLSQQLTVPELAAICERAALYIGNDSGMSHLASAVNTPTVTIFGPTSPDMYRPLGPNATACNPARQPSNSWLPLDLRRRSTTGVSGIDIAQVSVEEVLEACERLLARSRSVERMSRGDA